MKILIVDDELHNQILLQKILEPYGDSDIAGDGREAVEMFTKALEEKDPYKMVCLDIMMPEMDGQEALKTMRKTESDLGVDEAKQCAIFMTTALDGEKEVVTAFFKGNCTDYVVKPISSEVMVEKMKAYKLIPQHR